VIRSRFPRIHAPRREQFQNATSRSVSFIFGRSSVGCARVDIFQGPFITGGVKRKRPGGWYSGEMHFKEARADQFAAKLSLCKAALALWRTADAFTLRKGGRTDGWASERAKRKHARASYLRYTLLCTGKNYLHAARKLLITKDSQKRHPQCIPLSSYRAPQFHQDSLAKVAGARFAHPNANQTRFERLI
jgi:hypothetical protein